MSYIEKLGNEVFSPQEDQLFWWSKERKTVSLWDNINIESQIWTEPEFCHSDHLLTEPTRDVFRNQRDTGYVHHYWKKSHKRRYFGMQMELLFWMVPIKRRWSLYSSLCQASHNNSTYSKIPIISTVLINFTGLVLNSSFKSFRTVVRLIWRAV